MLSKLKWSRLVVVTYLSPVKLNREEGGVKEFDSRATSILFLLGHHKNDSNITEQKLNHFSNEIR